MRLSNHLFSILLAQAVAHAAPSPEAAPEADRYAPGNPIQGLGRYLKRVLGLETRDEISYFGDYGAYGEYGNYGTYPGSGAESSAESSAGPTTTTTQATTTLTTSITLSVATTKAPTITECPALTSIYAPTSGTITCIRAASSSGI